jgi:hypothetical protein
VVKAAPVKANAAMMAAIIFLSVIDGTFFSKSFPELSIAVSTRVGCLQNASFSF